MTQKAKKVATTTDRLRNAIRKQSELYSLGRIRRTPAAYSNAPLGNLGGSAGGTQSSQGNFLKTKGDTMVGPIAFYPATVSITGSDELDISVGATSNHQSSSYVIASFSSPDKIQLIKGAQFSGQKLWLQVPGASTLTLEDYSNNAGGNIVSGDSTDLVITTSFDPIVVELQYDVTLSPNGNNGGWSILYAKSITGGTATASFPLTPRITDYSDTWTSPVAIDLSTTDGHVHKFTVDADLTLTFSNPPSSGTQMTFELELQQDGTGSTFTVTLPAEVRQLSTITLDQDDRGVYVFRTNDGGTTYDVVEVVSGTTNFGFLRTDLSNLSASNKVPENIDMNLNDLTNIDRAMFISNTGTSATDVNIAVNSSDTKLVFNVPTGYEWTFTENNVQKWTMSPGTLTGANYVASNTVLISNSSTDPVADGIFTVNGTDVKVHTGGMVKNLSDIGSAGSPLTTKGDLFGYDTADARIPVGADGQVLLADTAASPGVKWGIASQIKIADTEVTITDVGAGNIVGKVDNIQQFNVTATSFNIDNDVNLGALSTDTITFNAVADSDLNMDNNSITNFNSLRQNGTEADAGALRLINDASIRWRNAADSANLLIKVNTSDELETNANFIANSSSQLIGKETARWGTIWATSLDLTNVLQVDGNAIIEGNVSLGNASTDDVNINGDVATDIVFKSSGLTVDFPTGQSTVGAAGLANNVPASPDTYIIIKHLGTEYVIPAFAKS